MRTLRSLINKATVYLTIVSFMALMCGGVSFAQSNGSGERSLENSAREITPSWLNADLYKTYKVKEINEGDKGAQAGENAEYLEKELGQSLAEDTTTKVKPDLKKKTGGETTDASGVAKEGVSFLSPEGTILITADYEVDIGSGEAEYQYHDEDGRLMWEYIDGIKHIYVGFDDAGYAFDGTTDSIQNAIDIADSRDVILVYAGTYVGDIDISHDVRIYGGFNSSGQRDIAGSTTTITGNIDVTSTLNADSGTMELGELNGFYMSADSRIDASNSDFALIDLTFGNNTYVSVIDGNVWIKVTSGGLDWPSTSRTGPGGLLAYFSAPDTTVSNVGNPRLEDIPSVSTPATISDTLETPMRKWNRPGRQLHDETVMISYITFGTNYSNPMNKDNLKTIFKGLLTNKDALALDAAGALDPALIAKLLQDILGEAALPLSIDEIDSQVMEIAMILANIFKNPTSEQKLMIDVLQELLDEAQKLEEETGNEDLKKATDDFTEMVATVLLAQALPDLLKKGDISNMKSVFEELDMEKEQILREYKDSVRIYYKSLVEELAANMATLQLKDILSKSLTERELGKLSTQRIDEIVNKIRSVKDKTITEEQILKVEGKYREEYLVPAKRILEENIKILLQGFTKKLFSVLDGAGLVKEKTVEGKPVLNIDLSVR